MEERFDGEEARNIILKLEDPKDLSLGKIVEQLFTIYTTENNLKGLCNTENINESDPDAEACIDIVRQRQKKLYDELDRREKLYLEYEG